VPIPIFTYEYEADDQTGNEIPVKTELLEVNGKATGTEVMVKLGNQLDENRVYVLKTEDTRGNGISDRSGNELKIACNFRAKGSYRLFSETGPHDVYDTLLMGSTLFVASGFEGIRIFDVSNPSDIHLITTYTNFAGEVQGLAKYREDENSPYQLIAVGGGSTSLGFIKVLDISDLNNIVQIKSQIISDNLTDSVKLPLGHPRHVRVLGQYAFVTIPVAGLAVVDIEGMTTHSNRYNLNAVIRYHHEDSISDAVPYQRLIKDPTNPEDPGKQQVLAVVLVNNYGIRILDMNRQDNEDPIDPYSKYNMLEVGSFQLPTSMRDMLAGLELVEDYWVDIDQDGIRGEEENIDEDEVSEEDEKRDLVFFAIPKIYKIVVLDITGTAASPDIYPESYGQLQVQEEQGDPAVNMRDLEISKEDQVLYATDMQKGLVLLDMSISGKNIYSKSSQERYLGNIHTSGHSQFGLIIDEDLNTAYVGQQDKGVDVIKLGNPEIKFVYKTREGTYREVTKICPSGIKSADNPAHYPGEIYEIYVMGIFPGGIASNVSGDDKTVYCELWSLNSSQAPVIPWDNSKIKTFIKKLGLTRQSDNPTDELYKVFLSDPIRVTIAPDEQMMTDTSVIQILSGDIMWVHLSGDFITAALQEIYINKDLAVEIGDRKPSIRADLIDRVKNFAFKDIPATETEKPNSPANNPSIYSNVLLHSGELAWDEIDLHIPGRGFDFVFARTYRSQAIYSGVLGWGWDHNYNKRLVELYSGDIIYYDGSGRRERYKKDQNTGKYQSPKGWFVELSRSEDGQFYLIYPDRTIEHYDSIGRLIKIQDRNRNYMEFYYNVSGQLSAIMDTMGRIIDFEYYPFAKETDDNGIPEGRVNILSGRLHRIIDYSGRTIEFIYNDQTGDLWQVDFMGRVKKYIYTTNDDIKLAHNLEKIIDPLGVASNSPVLTVTYDSYDNVDKQRYIEMDADIDFTIGNPSPPSTTTVTDAMGNIKIFDFPADNRLDVTNGGHTVKYEFNDDRLITRIDFPEGNYVTYEYYPAIGSNKHPAGNLHFLRQFPGPAGGDILETEYKYHTWSNQVNYIKDAKGNETFIDHDNNGNIDKIALPGINQPYDYDYYPVGKPEIYGVLKSITDPEGNVTEYEYYPENNPGGGSNTLQSRMMNTNIGGYLKKVTVDRNGVNLFKSYVYNQLGYLIESEDGEGVETVYDYIDQNGNLNPYGEVQQLIQGAGGSNTGQPPANLITTFTYDANGNVDMEASSSGITIDYGYDRLNRLTSKSYQGGNEVMTYGFKYDNNSNLKEVTYPDQVRKDTFTYNSRDFLETETSGSGSEVATIEYKYTPNGNLFSEELLNSEFDKITYGYDGHGRLQKVYGPYSTITYDYDKNSNLETVDSLGKTDGKTLNLVYQYDQLNRFTHHKLKKADGVYIVTELGYNRASHMNKVISPNNHTWVITPNGAGLPGMVEDPLNNKDEYKYYHHGLFKELTETESGGRSLTHNLKYNVLGDLWRAGDTFRGLDKYKYEYKPVNKMLDISEDPEGGAVTYDYDGLNRISHVTRKIEYKGDIRDAVTQYRYTPNGQLEKIFDDAGNFTHYIYDSKDRLKDIYYPEAVGSMHFTYNKNDQLKTYTDLNGTLLTNTYDAAGRLRTRTILPGQEVGGSMSESYDYDDLGRLSSAENEAALVTFDYNTAGRVYRETQELRDSEGNVTSTYVVGYKYDDNGNLTNLTYPSNTDPADSGSPKKVVVYTPDELDRIDLITSGGTAIADYDYEGKAKVTDNKLFDGTVLMKTIFDDGRRPESLTYKSGVNTLFERGMTWNLMDMKRSETGPGIDKVYSYDTAWRLKTEINKSDKYIKDYSELTIDDDENLEQILSLKNGKSLVTLKCQHENKRHQLTKVDYSNVVDNKVIEFHVVPSYDKNGNMKSFVHQYKYDYKNQLKEVVTGTGLNVEYKYDALGRRTEKIVSAPGEKEITRYVNAGWRVIEERDENNALLKRYTYGNGIDEQVAQEYNTKNGIFTFLPMYDSTGNMIGITDDTGKLIEKYSYSVFGMPEFDYDSSPPIIKNVHVIDGIVITGFSEPVNIETITSGMKVKHEGTVIQGTIEPGAGGKEIKFIPSTPLQPGQMSVEIAETVEDEAGNQMGSSFTNNFTYSQTTTIVHDTDSPEVDRIEKSSNDFIVTFSERIDPYTTTESIEITKADGTISGSVTNIDERTVKFTPDEMLEAHKEYTLYVNSTIKDLSGKSLNQFFHSFMVLPDDFLVYERPDPNKHVYSRIGNNYLFHGREYEPEVGLSYYRHRYYMPRIGRFLQTDPTGYMDSMNLSQAFYLRKLSKKAISPYFFR
jgi:RHS repeat-associated protein